MEDQTQLPEIVHTNGLCCYCQRLVEQLTCVRAPFEGVPLSQKNTNQQTTTIRAYPSEQYIVKAGHRGCHMCSLLTSAVLEHRCGDAQLTAETRIGNGVYVISPYWTTTLKYELKLCYELGIHKGLHHKSPAYISYEGCRPTASLQTCKHWSEKGAQVQERLQTSRKAEKYSITTASTTSVKLIRDWTKQCQYEHRTCTMTRMNQSPTRLLDLKTLKREDT